MNLDGSGIIRRMELERVPLSCSFCEVSLFASVFTEHDYADYGCINADSFASLSFDFFSFRQALVGFSPRLQLWLKKRVILHLSSTFG